MKTTLRCYCKCIRRSSRRLSSTSTSQPTHLMPRFTHLLPLNIFLSVLNVIFWPKTCCCCEKKYHKHNWIWNFFLYLSHFLIKNIRTNSAVMCTVAAALALVQHRSYCPHKTFNYNVSFHIYIPELNICVMMSASLLYIEFSLFYLSNTKIQIKLY